MRHIIRIMALLAPSPQIQIVAILRRVVEVRYREHHMRARFRMGTVILGPAPLTGRMFYDYSTGADHHAGAAQYPVTDRIPVPRVPALIFRLYRHCLPHAAPGPVYTP